MFIFFLLLVIKLAVKTIKANLAKSEVVKIFLPFIIKNLLVEDQVELVIQVNGKLRGKIEVAIDLDKQKVEELALQNENVLKHIDDKDIKKIIYVPNKLINVVV